MKQVFTVLVISVISACAVSPNEETRTDEVTVAEGARPSDPQAASSTTNVSPTALTDDLAAAPQFSCGVCFVRCSNAAPAQCRWTHAMNIGPRGNCGGIGGAGDIHCANLG